MKIAVLGTGRIGGTLGRAFAGAGHEVTFGSRDAATDADVGTGTTATVTDVGSAIEAGDVVVLAVPGAAVAGLVREHAQRFGGRLVVDAANVIGGTGPANSSEVITSAAPAVRYARAFNIVGFENLQNPRYGDVVGDMFFSCGDSDRDVVEELVHAVGLRPVYLGEGTQALLDDVLRLWFTLSQQRGTRRLGFKVLGDDA